MNAVERRTLGRGLSALLGENIEEMTAPSGEKDVRTLPVEHLQPGKFQPRRRFDQDGLEDLVESVREKGILQPILVRQLEGKNYEIIAGERRWRAAQQAQLHEVPVIVKDFSDQEALEAALVENLQRQDLSPLEEAEGYRRLMEEFEHTQEALGQVVGKSRSHIANTLRLLNLTDSIKEMVDEGKLTAGHARALLAAKHPDELAKKVLSQGLNVRQTEKLVKLEGLNKEKKVKEALEKDTDTIALERDLSALLGLKVAIRFMGRGGEITFHYNSLEQLDEILKRLNHQQDDELTLDVSDTLMSETDLLGDALSGNHKE